MKLNKVLSDKIKKLSFFENEPEKRANAVLIISSLVAISSIILFFTL